MKKKTIKKLNKTSLQRDVQELKDIIFPAQNYFSGLYSIFGSNISEENKPKEKRNKIKELENQIDNLSTKLNKLEEYLGINYCEDKIDVKKYSKKEPWLFFGKIREFINNL